MATIYLSATYEDLKAYRLVAFETQRKSGHHVLPMEDDIATHQRPVEKCHRDGRLLCRAVYIMVRLCAFCGSEELEWMIDHRIPSMSF